MPDFDPQRYGPVFATLVNIDRCRPLDAGQPQDSAANALTDLTTDSAFAHASLADGEMAGCCLAGVWLLYDFLDDSHRISQGIQTPSGSFWHGIMHRREGDFSNSKYWFRNTGDHPVLADLATAAAAAGYPNWDPFDFVDACEEAIRGGAGDLCLTIQQIEWELLFDYCYSAAIAD